MTRTSKAMASSRGTSADPSTRTIRRRIEASPSVAIRAARSAEPALAAVTACTRST